MACCCNAGKPKASSCLGRCDLPKHRCLDKEEIKPGPVPKYMGWLWDARNSPEHQLRCGWRPGHISCPVLRKIEQHNSCLKGDCGACPGKSFPRPPCVPRTPCNFPNFPCNTCCAPSKTCSRTDSCSPYPCLPSSPSCTKPSCPGQAIIRITRHGGNYTISTEPSSVSNSPSGPYPLKYVLNVDDDKVQNAKYSVEAKFNDYHFDYTTSQTSFVLDFSPPEQKCLKPCPKRSVTCLPSVSDVNSSVK